MRRLTWAMLTTAAVAGPAGAFYFPGWPADGLPRPVTLYGAANGYGPGPIETEILIKPPPPLVRDQDGPNGPGVQTPQTVPEPVSFALAAIGVGVVAGWRKAKRTV